MFHYKNLEIMLHPEVYEPSEDTFQLLESVQIKKDDKVFEIGTGTGLIALECCRIGSDVLCSDINPYAIEIAKKNFEINKSKLKGKLELRRGDLFSVLHPGETFDIIIFNPPYLPTKPSEIVGGSGWFDIATDGGIDGLDITKQFIQGLSSFLSEDGCAYFVFSSLSDRIKLDNCISKAKMKTEVVKSCGYDDETLDVYCIRSS